MNNRKNNNFFAQDYKTLVIQNIAAFIISIAFPYVRTKIASNHFSTPMSGTRLMLIFYVMLICITLNVFISTYNYKILVRNGKIKETWLKKLFFTFSPTIYFLIALLSIIVIH